MAYGGIESYGCIGCGDRGHKGAFFYIWVSGVVLMVSMGVSGTRRRQRSGSIRVVGDLQSL